MLQLLVRAALLDRRVYNNLSEGAGSMYLSLLVVALAALAFGAGMWDTQLQGLENSRGSVIAVSILTVLVGWILWATAAYLVGSRILGGPADHRQLLQALGIAHGPGILMCLLWVPFAGLAFYTLSAFWLLAAGTVAVAGTEGFSLTRAFIPSLAGWLLVFVVLRGFLLPLA